MNSSYLLDNEVSMRLGHGRFARLLLGAALVVPTLVGGWFVAPSPATAAAPYSITAGQLAITLDASGTITSLVNTTTGKEYATSAHRRSLIQLVADGAQQLPTALSYNSSTSTYDFTFGAISTDVLVKVVQKSGYATFEVTSVDAGAGVDVQILMWGPITTSITKTVGEAAGVVYDSDFAIGIHELNDKTIGGWVNEYDNLSYDDPTYDTQMVFEWCSARRTDWGSFLQAYTADYGVTRTRGAGMSPVYPSMWVPNDTMPALTGSDAQIVGSKIALFGAATSDVLPAISGIQTGEGLIHPTLNGQWDKTSQANSASFLVLSDINAATVDEASLDAKAAGLSHIYALVGANGPWATNGHFGFSSAFGGSDAGAKAIVDAAATHGVEVGVHTLSDFIDPGDAYVNPATSGLTVTGTTTLTRNLGASDTTAYVSSDAPFAGAAASHLQIGNELLGYTGVAPSGAPNEWAITGLTRHIWGTTASAATAGSNVARLALNEYGGGIGNLATIPAIAGRLASIFNTTGIKAMSFDGLESASQAGYGTLGTNHLVNGMYRQLTSTDGFYSEASNLMPNTWDAQTRVSWGESSTSLSTRYNYMAYFKRSFMPAMIGWTILNNNVVTTEAQLAKMAGWNAGTGFETSVGGLNAMSNKTATLEAIKQWETARNLHAFTPSQQARLRDMSSYWHLSVVTPGSRWSLQKTDSAGAAIGSPEDVFVGNTDPAGTETNLALTATATASSQYDSRYLAGNAIDGVVGQDGYGEWASKGETNPWLKLDWNSAQTISKVTFYDRPDTPDWTSGGTLTFSDGSAPITVSGIPNDGTPYSITFPDKTVTWVKFQVTGGSGPNNGLSEIKVSRPETDLARSATASASSVYDSRYVASNAVDGITGQAGAGEWASLHELDPWLKLDWSSAQTINKITFYDRPNTTDWAPGGTLTFSDGSAPITVSGIPNDGTPYSISFPDKTVTWVKFQVAGGSGSNVGLSEVEVTDFPPQNLARSATASASSVYDSRYVASNAVDGITGQAGAGEWASLHELDPWLKLDWSSAQTINKITFYDRPNTTDWAPGGTLTFSDGSAPITVSGIPNDGTPYSISFPDKTVTWVKFQVAGGSGGNVGLSELEALHF
jgi:hypothetical protein